MSWRADEHRLFAYRELDELDELESRWATHFEAHVAPLYTQVAPRERAAWLRSALEAADHTARADIEAGVLYGALLMPEARRSRGRRGTSSIMPSSSTS